MATYKVQSNGKAQSGLKAGDQVVTGGGTYKITGVNADGSYQSSKVSNVTTSTYTGTYANSGGASAAGAAQALRSGNTTAAQNILNAVVGKSSGGSSGSSGGGSGLPAGATQTTYIDANGNKQTGYIINGSTFTDAAGTTPVGVGSIVNTGGGQYIKTATGSQLYADYLKNNGITPTTIYNSQGGNPTQGYIKNGVTYTDALLSQQVPVGTVVDTGGGAYIKTENGSMLYADYLAGQQQLAAQQQLAEQNDAVKYYEDLLEQIKAEYQTALSVNDTTYAKQLEQARLQVQQQIAALNRQYQDLNKQLYIDYMNSRKNLPQQLAAQGYTGGLTESGMLGLETGYQGQLAANERERLTGINDLEAGGLNSELELRIAQAQADQAALSDYNSSRQRYAAALVEQMNRAEDLAREDEETAYNRSLYAEQQAAQAEADTVYGYSADGGTYGIGSAAGLYFVNNAQPGATMTGEDKSTWVKNADGSVTISKGGKTYTVGGAGIVSGSGSGRGSSGGGSPENGSDDVWAKVDAYVAIGGDAEDYIKAHYKDLGYSSASQAIAAYTVRMTEQTAQQAQSGGTTGGVGTSSLGTVTFSGGRYHWNGNSYASIEALDAALSRAYGLGAISNAQLDAIAQQIRAMGLPPYTPSGR